MNTPTLETERLILRRFTGDDLDALFRIYADEEANTFLPWFPARTLADARVFYEQRYAAVYARPRGYAYAICLKEDACADARDGAAAAADGGSRPVEEGCPQGIGAPAGCDQQEAGASVVAGRLQGAGAPVGYIKVDVEGDSYDLGYGLRREFWHRGITTEAAQALIKQVRRDGLPYITATHDVNNPRSGAVMRRLGMTYRYSYEELWQPKNFPVTFCLYQLDLDGNEHPTCQKYWDVATVHFVEEGL